MAQVLSGYKVLDFSHVLAGPIATNHLRLQGAEVIKVESAAGDTMRNYGGEKVPEGLGPSFVAVNTGKRSIVLDLKNPGHREVARKLVAWADVVVENFRPGVIGRLGLGYEDCRAIKPDIVFCSVSGFGQSGPLQANPAIDQIIQSMSGLMTLSGDPGSPAMRVGFPLVDTYTGLTAAHAIVLALLRRERTGEGQFIDVAMMDAAMAMMVSVAGPWLAAGIRPRKTGNLGYSKSPTADTFPTAEGEITLGVVRQEQYELLCRVLERPDLVTDGRFSTRALRQRNAAELRVEVIKALAAHDAVEWERRMNAIGVAAGAVRELPEALAMEHFAHRGMKLPVQLPHGEGHVLNAGMVFAQDAPGVHAQPPRLGEHTREVLAELGYSPEDVERLASEALASIA